LIFPVVGSDREETTDMPTLTTLRWWMSRAYASIRIVWMD